MHYSDDDLKRIYLQLGKTEEDDDWDDTEGVTWCVDRINDSDAEYVRRDVAVKLRVEWLAWADLENDDAGRLFHETAWLAELSPALSPIVPYSRQELVLNYQSVLGEIRDKRERIEDLEAELDRLRNQIVEIHAMVQ